MEAPESAATFRTAVARSRSVACLSGSMDAYDVDEPFTRLFFLDVTDPEPWLADDYEFSVPSVCNWTERPGGQSIFVALSEEGEVVLLSNPDVVVERIADAGVHHDQAKGYGYLSHIRQIGKRLYACGFSGQVYCRNGRDDWVHMDAGILQQPGMEDGQFFASVINGPHERAIYVAGCDYVDGYPPHAEFWNGSRWTRLELPVTAGRITDIHVETGERIVMCGDNGTLLVGNARDGFSTMGPLGATHLFYSVTKFADLYYLASNLGLYQFNPKAATRVFRKVRSRLKPEIYDANVVQAVDDVLWSMGGKDIVRFDGKKWERFEHPDNLSIGELDEPGDE